jgi:hypothetical protein
VLELVGFLVAGVDVYLKLRAARMKNKKKVLEVSCSEVCGHDDHASSIYFAVTVQAKVWVPPRVSWNCSEGLGQKCDRGPLCQSTQD